MFLLQLNCRKKNLQGSYSGGFNFYFLFELFSVDLVFWFFYLAHRFWKYSFKQIYKFIYVFLNPVWSYVHKSLQQSPTSFISHFYLVKLKSKVLFKGITDSNYQLTRYVKSLLGYNYWLTAYG
jgi:hypothetical protein